MPLHTDRHEFFARVSPAVEQLKAIAKQSGEALYLCDGPINPDYALLDLCAEALYFATAVEKVYAARTFFRDIQKAKTEAEIDACRHKDERMLAECRAHSIEAKNRILKARKIKALSPAGIYAKALLVRSSKTGAGLLAMSLAEDLVDCEGLRALLWPAGGDGA